MDRLMNTSTLVIVIPTTTIPAHLYEATSFKEVQNPLEDFNHIAWFPIDEAIQNLKRGSHKMGHPILEKTA